MKAYFPRVVLVASVALVGLFVGLSSAASAGGVDFVVGGGRTAGTGATCGEANFALNGHVDASLNGTTGNGTFNLTQPATAICEEGHFTSKVDCVLVGGNGPGTAAVTAHVTQSTGDMTAFFPVGTEVRVQVTDSGLPGGTGDTIGIGRTTTPCDFAQLLFQDPVDNGNIHVHQAS